MVSFKDALNEGLEAARRAEAIRNEIQTVFADLDKQIEEVCNGKVKIERRKLKETVDVKDLLSHGLTYSPPSYWAIVAFNPSIANDSLKELARWRQEREGYPCTISIGSNSFVCEDKSTLESALQEVLKDPIVGRKISQLMALDAE